MANIKSQKKRIGLNEKNRQRNIAVRSAIKTRVKHVNEAVAENKGIDELQALLKTAVSEIDRGVRKGIIHRNTAARKKARLRKHVNEAAGN